MEANSFGAYYFATSLIYPTAEQFNQAIKDYFVQYGVEQTCKDMPIILKLYEELRKRTFYKTLLWLPNKHKAHPQTIEGIVERVAYKKDGFGLSKPFLRIREPSNRIIWQTSILHSHIVNQIERRVLENDEFNVGDKIRITWVGERKTKYENPQILYEIEVIEKSDRPR